MEAEESSWEYLDPDDGEKTLGNLVATWSLGAPGDMFFRIKKAYAHPVLNEATPTGDVVIGPDCWEERTNLNNASLLLQGPLTTKRGPR